MNSLNDVWQSVLDQLSAKITPTALNTWFNKCEPVEITADCKLVLHVENDFKKSIINERFGETIRNTLSDLFSCNFDYILLTDDELEEYKETKPDDNPLPESLAYTFDRFIVGESNKYAHASAIAVAHNPGSVYNPLFIYGNSGLGKTHLLLAIGSYIHEHNPEKLLMYVKGYDFVNEVVNAIREGNIKDFHSKYSNIDLFLVDDIQFISGKPQTEIEFFNVFNNIYEAGHQIVITSDRPPKEMPSLAERLQSRFEGGLLADIQPPDFETRVAIIKNKAAQLGLILDDYCVTRIATKVTTNIRQMEGVIKQLTAYKEIIGGVITPEFVDKAINTVTREGPFVPTADMIIKETSRYYSISEAEIKGPSHSKPVTLARQVAMYLIRSLIMMPLADIGNEFNRNHTTVLASINKIEDLIKTDSRMQATIRDISSNVNAR